jgi:UDP-N-acetyl-D-glucosamine dehydrogenase
LGVAYKRDIDDVRESPALDIIHLLQQLGAKVTFSDPFVPSIRIENQLIMGSPVTAVADADCTVVITDHTSVDYSQVVASANIIVDTRNALRSIKSQKIIRL